jgi:epoxide hydrolase 4
MVGEPSASRMPTLPVSQLPEAWEHGAATINGCRFHYVAAGMGPLVILLHGFPEFWYSWRHQIPALAHAGFHVIALDLRGYNDSDKPVGVHNYRVELLIADVAGLIRQVGAGPAIVVGHDWGGVIAWLLAMVHPELVDRLIVLNAPHPLAYLRELRRPAQWLRSLYIAFFQLPWLPEQVLAAWDYALVEWLLRRQPVQGGAFGPQDIRRYKTALARPGALTAALNYYRAALRYGGAALKDLRPIMIPTLLLWGEQDPYLSIRLTEGLRGWVPSLNVIRLPEASHWVQNDVPERVNELILAFLRKTAP